MWSFIELNVSNFLYVVNNIILIDSSCSKMFLSKSAPKISRIVVKVEFC